MMQTKFALPGFKKFITSECPFAGCSKQNLFSIDDSIPLRVCEHFSHVQKESITARDTVITHMYVKPGVNRIADTSESTVMALAAAVRMLKEERDALKAGAELLEIYATKEKNEKRKYKRKAEHLEKENSALTKEFTKYRRYIFQRFFNTLKKFPPDKLSYTKDELKECVRILKSKQKKKGE